MFCRSVVCSGDSGWLWSAITRDLPRSMSPCSRACRVGARVVVMVVASRTLMPAVTGEIRRAAAISAAARQTAASGTQSSMRSGESLVVREFLRASRVARHRVARGEGFGQCGHESVLESGEQG